MAESPTREELMARGHRVPAAFFTTPHPADDPNGAEVKRAVGAAENKNGALVGENKSDAFDPATATREDLTAEAKRRGIVVERGDGKPGEPLMEDYRAALAA